MNLVCIVLVLIALYLLAIMPRIFNRPIYTPIMDWYYAHRGFHDNLSESPENSMAAFKLAMDKGYGIELDVQLTRDNKVVVFHDFDLKRICHADVRVCELSYRELKSYSILNSKQTIPLFEDVLRLVDGKVPLIVELKCKDSRDKIAFAANQLLQDYHGAYCVESFHPIALAWYRKNHPDIIRGQLADIHGKQKDLGMTAAYFLQGHLLFNFISKPDFIAYNHRHQNELSRNICRKLYGILSAAWTIKSEEEYMKCKENFDLFIFEGFQIK